MKRTRVVWTGLIGLPGVSTFYCQDSDDTFVQGLNDFYQALKISIPTGCTIQVENQGDVLDPVTGEITGVWEDDPVGPIACSGGGSYAAPVGALVRWRTSGVAGGRHIQGHTFIVPLGVSNYQSNGTMDDDAIAAFQTFAGNLVTSNQDSFQIWRKPFAGTPAWTDAHGKVHAARAAHAGSVGMVTSAQVPDKVAILSSRRQ